MQRLACADVLMVLLGVTLVSLCASAWSMSELTPDELQALVGSSGWEDHQLCDEAMCCTADNNCGEQKYHPGSPPEEECRKTVCFPVPKCISDEGQGKACKWWETGQSSLCYEFYDGSWAPMVPGDDTAWYCICPLEPDQYIRQWGWCEDKDM